MIRLIFLTIVSLALISCQSSTGALGSLIATITPTPEPTATATPVPPTPTPEPTATTTPTPIPDVIATALFSANLRQGPGTDYARVGGVAIGDQFIVIGKNDQGNWWQLAESDGEPAWISAELVEIQGPVEFVEIVP